MRWSREARDARPGGRRLPRVLLFVGRNGIFIDRKGADRLATIPKIVDNPSSIRQDVGHLRDG